MVISHHGGFPFSLQMDVKAKGFSQTVTTPSLQEGKALTSEQHTQKVISSYFLTDQIWERSPKQYAHGFWLVVCLVCLHLSSVCSQEKLQKYLPACRGNNWSTHEPTHRNSYKRKRFFTAIWTLRKLSSLVVRTQCHPCYKSYNELDGVAYCWEEWGPFFIVCPIRKGWNLSGKCLNWCLVRYYCSWCKSKKKKNIKTD